MKYSCKVDSFKGAILTMNYKPRKILVGLMLSVVMPLGSMALLAQPGVAEPNGCRGYENDTCGRGGEFCWVGLCTSRERMFYFDRFPSWLNWP
jgi:hypothetical protein